MVAVVTHCRPCPLLPHLKELPGTEEAPLGCVGAGEQSAPHPVLEAMRRPAGLGVQVCYCSGGAACEEVH